MLPDAAFPATKHGGTLPMNGSLLTVSGGAAVSSVKTAEDSADASCMAVRLYNPNPAPVEAKLSLGLKVASADLMDINENIVQSLPVNGGTVCVGLGAYETATVALSVK